uniref:Uncharacterized protein n=1 Tax=Caenorhabditis tropicalis TaxID=1561998 RepID=A0A1I7TTX9_9PELO
MKELLVLLLLFPFFCTAMNENNSLVTKGELFTIQNSLIDRMVDSNFEPYMKFIVFYNMRQMSFNNSLNFLMNIVEIVKNNQMYLNPEAVGGEKGAEAVKRLADAYIETENKEGMIQFMELCVELMKSPNVPKEMWQNFFFLAVGIWNEKGQQPMSKVKEELMSGQFEVPEKLLNALGIYYKLTISDEAIANLTQFWKLNPGLDESDPGREHLVSNVIRFSVEPIKHLVPMLQAFQNSDRLTHEEFFHLRLSAEQFWPFFNTAWIVLDPIYIGFDFKALQLIMNDYSDLNEELKAIFMEKVNGNEGMKKFFEKLHQYHFKGIARFIEYILPFHENLDMAKVRDFISLWNLLNELGPRPMQRLLEDVMTRKARFEDCKKLYEDQNVSEQAKKVVEITRRLKTGNRFGSCTGNVATLEVIPKDTVAFVRMFYYIANYDFFAFSKTLELFLSLNSEEQQEFVEKDYEGNRKELFKQLLDMSDPSEKFLELRAEMDILTPFLLDWSDDDIDYLDIFIRDWSKLPAPERLIVEKVYYNEMDGKTCDELARMSESHQEDLRNALKDLEYLKLMDSVLICPEFYPKPGYYPPDTLFDEEK